MSKARRLIPLALFVFLSSSAQMNGGPHPFLKIRLDTFTYLGELQGFAEKLRQETGLSVYIEDVQLPGAEPWPELDVAVASVTISELLDEVTGQLPDLDWSLNSTECVSVLLYRPSGRDPFYFSPLDVHIAELKTSSDDHVPPLHLFLQDPEFAARVNPAGHPFGYVGSVLGGISTSQIVEIRVEARFVNVPVRRILNELACTRRVKNAWHFRFDGAADFPENISVSWF